MEWFLPSIRLKKLPYCNNSILFVKDNDRTLPHYIGHSKIIKQKLANNMDDIYDYFHYSSSDDVTENYLTDENQNPYFKKMGKS